MGTAYEWDRNYNGTTFFTDTVGQSAQYVGTATTGSVNIAMEVTDLEGQTVMDVTTITTENLPMPSGLSASVASSSEIDLAWSAYNSSTPSSTTILMSTDGTNFYTLGQVPAGTLSYAATGLDSGSTYYFQIASSDGNSAMSAVTAAVSASTGGIPSPEDLAATAVSPTEVDLTWDDPAGEATSFEVQRSSDGGATFTTLATVTAAADGSDSYDDVQTSDSTDDTYQIIGIDGSQTSNASATADAITPAATPTDVTVTAAADASSVTITWQNESSSLSAMVQIDRSTDGNDWENLATVSADSASYEDDSVIGQTSYAYRVATITDLAQSTDSATVSVTTPLARPDAPVNVTASAIDYQSITVAWTASSGTGGAPAAYTVSISSDNPTAVVPDDSGTLSATTFSYTFSGLSSQSSYAFTVTAENNAGNSPASAAVTAATPACQLSTNTPVLVLSAASDWQKAYFTWTYPGTDASGWEFQNCDVTAGENFHYDPNFGNNPQQMSTFSQQLIPGDSYQFRMLADHADGSYSGWSNTVNYTAPLLPDAPQVDARVVEPDQFAPQIVLGWSGVPSGYHVQVQFQGDGWSDAGWVRAVYDNAGDQDYDQDISSTAQYPLAGGGSAPYLSGSDQGGLIDLGVNDDTGTYSYRVRAIAPSGQPTAWSDTVTQSLGHADALLPTVNHTDTAITLNFSGSAPAYESTDYFVLMVANHPAQLDTTYPSTYQMLEVGVINNSHNDEAVSGQPISYQFTNLNPGWTYHFAFMSWLETVDGSMAFSRFNVQMDGSVIPAAVINPIAFINQLGQTVLHWTDPATISAGTVIQGSNNQATWTTVAQLPAGSATAVVPQSLFNTYYQITHIPVGGTAPAIGGSAPVDPTLPILPVDLGYPPVLHALYVNDADDNQAVTANANSTAALTVQEQGDGTVKLLLDADELTFTTPQAIILDAPNIAYNVSGLAASPNGGHFDNASIPLVLTITTNYQFSITASAGGLSATVNVTVSPFFVKLDVDSDNDGQITPADDPIKNDPGKPGMVMMVNDQDNNNDGVPDYAEGFTGDSSLSSYASDTIPGSDFYPMQVSFSPQLNRSSASLTFTYNASNPMAMTAPTDGVSTFTPAGGDMRIWTVDADEPRSIANNYITPGIAYPISHLARMCGADADASTLQFWIEAINPSQVVAGDNIGVTLDDGNSEDNQPKSNANTTPYEVQFFDAHGADFKVQSAPSGGYQITQPPDSADSLAKLQTNEGIGGALTDGASLVACAIQPDLLPQMPFNLTVSETAGATHDPDPYISAYTLGSLYTWPNVMQTFPTLPAGDQNVASTTAADQGQSTQLNNLTGTGWFLYRPPDNFLIRGGPSANKAYEAGKIYFNLQTGNQAPKAVAFILRRPPILLVHGLLGSDKSFGTGAWQSWHSSPYNTYVDRNINYETNNIGGLDTNYHVIPDEIKKVLDLYRSANGIPGDINATQQDEWVANTRFAATRVDIVAHSMGGLLVEWYVAVFAANQSGKRGGQYADIIFNKTDPYLRESNFWAGDIHRFISLDTPFQGSEIANAIASSFDPGTLAANLKNHPIADLALSSLLYNGDNPKRTEAINDLQTNSAAIKALQAATYPSGSKQVLWHPFGGVAAQEPAKFSPLDTGLIDLANWAIVSKLVKGSKNTIQQLILPAASSDFIVTITSQINGVSYFDTTNNLLRGYTHTLIPVSAKDGSSYNGVTTAAGMSEAVGNQLAGVPSFNDKSPTNYDALGTTH